MPSTSRPKSGSQEQSLRSGHCERFRVQGQRDEDQWYVPPQRALIHPNLAKMTGNQRLSFAPSPALLQKRSLRKSPTSNMLGSSQSPKWVPFRILLASKSSPWPVERERETNPNRTLGRNERSLPPEKGANRTYSLETQLQPRKYRRLSPNQVVALVVIEPLKTVELTPTPRPNLQ